MYAKKEKIYCAYVSQHNWNREKQVILLTIPNEEKREVESGGWWHHLAVKILSELLRGITSNDHDDFYCLNCLHSFGTEKKT